MFIVHILTVHYTYICIVHTYTCIYMYIYYMYMYIFCKVISVTVCSLEDRMHQPLLSEQFRNYSIQYI